jgi:hypothetical protein
MGVLDHCILKTTDALMQTHGRYLVPVLQLCGSAGAAEGSEGGETLVHLLLHFAMTGGARGQERG